MKQKFSYLMMVLAMVILAGTSAMAAAGDSSADPAIWLSGSTHTVTITPGNGANTLTWTLYSGSAVGTIADAGHTSTTFPQSSASFDLVWTDKAAGSYYLEVLESDGSCTTQRGFHIWMLGFDAEVYASDNAGGRITGAALTSCGGSSGYPAFMNTFTDRTDGSTTGTDGDLADWVGSTAPMSLRNYSILITFDNMPSGSAFVPSSAVASIRFDSNLGTTNADLVSLNSGATTSATNDDVVVNGASNLFTFPITYSDRWGIDLNSQIIVTNVELFTAADAGGTLIGEEPVAVEDTDASDSAADDNISGTFVITGAPATSIISAP